MEAIALAILGYFLGAIPFAYLIPKAVKNIDIRTIGSRNAGATNVYRAMGFGWAAVVFVLDTAKGAVFAGILAYGTYLWPPSWAHMLLLSPVVGHCYSPFLRFQGGRGVATAAGVMIPVSPIALVVGFATYGSVVLLIRKSFVGSLAGLTVFLIVDLVYSHGVFPPLLLGVAALLVYRHRVHLVQLLKR